MKKILALATLCAVICFQAVAQTAEASEPKDSVVDMQTVPIEITNNDVQGIDEVAAPDTTVDDYVADESVAAESDFVNSGDSTQVVMDEKNVTAAYTPSSVGPNRKWHRQFYLQLGFMADNPNAGATIRYGLSTQWGLGFRLKRRFNNTFSATNEWGYRATTFNIKQEAGKLVPNAVHHNTEKIDFHSITSSLHLRVNVGRRGNYIGNFLEVGGYAGYAFVTRHLTWDNFHDEANTTKVVQKGLDYVNRLDYGLSGKIGINHWSLFTRYRMSKMFKNSSGYPEMSKLTIGVDLGF